MTHAQNCTYTKATWYRLGFTRCAARIKPGAVASIARRAALTHGARDMQHPAATPSANQPCPTNLRQLSHVQCLQQVTCLTNFHCLQTIEAHSCTGAPVHLCCHLQLQLALGLLQRACEGKSETSPSCSLRTTRSPREQTSAVLLLILAGARRTW